MKPAQFDYYAPDSLDEAVRLLAEIGDEAKVLAGGQSLVPILNLRLTRFAALIDIGRIEALRRFDVGSSEVTIGATVPYRTVETSAELAVGAPLFFRATPFIGHFQIRSRGTVGGAIAHADPAAEYPAVALALDCGIELTGPSGHRSVPAAEFFTGIWSTTAEPDEVVTAITIPVWGARSGFAIEEVARRHGDFALAGVCVGVQVAGERIARAAVSYFGMESTPVRSTRAEAALVGTLATEVDLDEIGQLAVADLTPPADLHASSGLRRRIGAAIASRALRSALAEAVA